MDILKFIIAMFVIGCVVLGTIDKDGRLLDWARAIYDKPVNIVEAFLNGCFYFLVVMLWPVVVYFYYRK